MMYIRIKKASSKKRFFLFFLLINESHAGALFECMLTDAIERALKSGFDS